EDLALRPPVDEDDEPEAVARLVVRVELRELRQHLRIVVASLFAGRARRERLRADRRMRVEHLLLLLVAQLVHERARADDRGALAGRRLDEAGPAGEELGELVGAQLPR